MAERAERVQHLARKCWLPRKRGTFRPRCVFRGGREGLAATCSAVQWVGSRCVALANAPHCSKPAGGRGAAVGFGGAAVPFGPSPMSSWGRDAEGVPKLLPNPKGRRSLSAPLHVPLPVPIPHIPSQCPSGVTGPGRTLSPFVGTSPQCHRPPWGHHLNAITLHGVIAPWPSPSMGTPPHCHHHPWGHRSMATTLYGGHHPMAITLHGDITSTSPPSMGLPFFMGPSPHCRHHPRGHHPTANTLHGAAVLHGAVTSLPSLSMGPSLSVGPSPHCHPLRDDITLPTPCPHSSQGIWTGCPHRVLSNPTILVPRCPPPTPGPLSPQPWAQSPPGAHLPRSLSPNPMSSPVCVTPSQFSSISCDGN